MAEVGGRQEFPEQNMDTFSGSVHRHLKTFRHKVFETSQYPPVLAKVQEVNPVTALGNAFQGLSICPLPLSRIALMGIYT